MASLPTHGPQHLSRLTTAARLARMRPPTALQLDGPGVLRTGRLLLRPLTWADREPYIEAVRASRAELDRYCPLHKAASELDDELFDRQLQLARAADATGRGMRRVAEDLSRTGRIVGAFNLNDIVHGLESRSEVSFWVRSDEAAKGLAGEAIRALLGHAFAPRWPQRQEGAHKPAGLGLCRVDALIAPDNTRCLKLVERLGFVIDDEREALPLPFNGREVVHTPYVIYSECQGDTPPVAAVPQGVLLTKSIDALLGIERRAAVKGP